MRGWPAATIVFYGPNLSRATKVAVGIVPSEGAEPAEMRDWKVETGDVRADTAVAGKILEFIESHGVLSIVMADGIMGCPHQEGVDYEGEWCPSPDCTFWHGRPLYGEANPVNRGRNLLAFISPNAFESVPRALAASLCISRKSGVHRASGQLQFGDFPLQNGLLLPKLARHTWAQSWRLQPFPNPGEPPHASSRASSGLFVCSGLRGPSNSLCRSELMRFQEPTTSSNGGHRVAPVVAALPIPVCLREDRARTNE